MDKRKIQELLDRTYELEGLLHLALAREDDLPAQLPGLIYAKIAELNEYDEYDDSERSEKEVVPSVPEVSVEESEEDITVADDDVVAREVYVEDEMVGVVRAGIKSGSVYHKENRKTPCVFSLNDRFLYIRELFGGNAKAFDDAMDVLSTMSDMREAEEYFYDECDFKPDNHTVEEFMKSVARYLEQ